MHSGSTCTAVLIKSNKIIVANIGDSRGILCSRTQGAIKCKVITRDHKPTIPEEAERIQAKGGEIARYKNKDGREVGPLRVWAKGLGVPGLAMTRSFGDTVAASVGTISEPCNRYNVYI